jgi:hypothetical protein
MSWMSIWSSASVMAVEYPQEITNSCAGMFGQQILFENETTLTAGQTGKTLGENAVRTRGMRAIFRVPCKVLARFYPTVII